ncbi:MAG: CapA family protein [Clostridia bacterium]|nr:CapA family protein [Clostridia bacterium]
MYKATTSITFTGDIGFSRYMFGKWEDPQLLSDDILKFFDSSDHVVANVEGAVVDPAAIDQTENRGMYCHYMNGAATAVLERIHADIWAIANNHSMDMDVTGLESTKRYAAAMGSRTIGAGSDLAEASRPVILDESGGIGILALGYAPDCPAATESNAGTFTHRHREQLAQRIREIKSACRWCVIVSHDGEEFTNLPQPYIRNKYLDYLELGADIVVAHHPHVTMNYELFNNKAVFYSLGNFIFDTDYQRAQHNTDRGVLLKLHFTPTEFSFESLGTTIVRGEERVIASSVPDIFTNLPQKEYEALLPLSAAAFVKAEIARMLFLYPERFGKYTTADWERFLLSEDREDFIAGERMDFSVILPLAKQMSDGQRETDKLTAVASYIRKQL